MSQPIGVSLARIEVTAPFDAFIPELDVIPCGGGACLGPREATPESCGTWLNLPNHCCRAQVTLNNTIGEVANFPCDAVPGLGDTPFDRFESPAITTPGNCPRDTRHINTDDSRYAGPLACCPQDEAGSLRWESQNRTKSYRCFDSTILDPSAVEPVRRPFTSTSSTSQSPSSSTGSPTSGSPSPTTELPPVNTSTQIPIPSPLPGSAPSGISKISSLIFGTAMLVVFLGAQL